MPTDPSTDPATATTRRAFLARTAVGGAAATAVLAAPLRALLPAGAQGTEEVEVEPVTEVVSDLDFGAVATPIELAAVDAYQLAIDADIVDDAWLNHITRFQSHHREVADTVATLRDPNLPAAVADPALLATTTAALDGAGDQEAVLAALATLENTLSATHLLALATVEDAITAKTVAQVLCTEAQQATFLALGAGDPVDELTPGEVTTDDAVDPLAVANSTGEEPEGGATSTTEATAGVDGDASTTTSESGDVTTTSSTSTTGASTDDTDTPAN